MVHRGGGGRRDLFNLRGAMRARDIFDLFLVETFCREKRPSSCPGNAEFSFQEDSLIIRKLTIAVRHTVIRTYPQGEGKETSGSLRGEKAARQVWGLRRRGGKSRLDCKKDRCGGRILD